MISCETSAGKTKKKFLKVVAQCVRHFQIPHSKPVSTDIMFKILEILLFSIRVTEHFVPNISNKMTSQDSN